MSIPIGIEPQTESLFDANNLVRSDLPPESRRFSAENANKLLPENVLAVYLPRYAGSALNSGRRTNTIVMWLNARELKPKPAGLGQNDPREEHAISIHRRCLDGSGFGRAVMDECRSVIRFSGTVSPLTLYQRLHGQPSNDAEDAGQVLRPCGRSHHLPQSKSKCSR